MPPAIESYRFGEITIDGSRYANDVIILPARVVPDWWRREGHSLSTDDLRSVLDELPARLIVGTGAYGRMRVPGAVVLELGARGIEVSAEPTGDAVETYRRLISEGTPAAACLHLTC